MIFLDSSEPAEIADIASWGVVSGITTNPLLFAREAKGADLEKRIRSILAVSTGPVSVELVTEAYDDMLAEARRYRAWDPARICVKVPFTEAGLRILATLSREGISTNATCIMAFNQAYLAALAGATYVSIFSGRVRDMGYDVRPVIADTRRQLDRERLASRIIVGSVRHVMDVNEALSAGGDIVTITPKVIRTMLRNPRTDETIREFSDAWHARGTDEPTSK